MKKMYLPVFFLLLSIRPSNATALTLATRPTAGIQYETMRFTVAGNFGFDNPFDLITNRVELHIRMPDSSKQVLSFFFNGLTPEKTEWWEARFAPKQPGRHGFSFRIGGKEQERFSLTVAANPGKKQGGLRLSDNFGAFRFESGEPFRGAGLNVCWADDYEQYFTKMSAVGLNTSRIWLCPWHLAFEWSKTGLGRYDLAAAQRLDTILELAKTYGIFILLCIDYHGVAQKEAGFFRENRWRENPYNKANGGPCADPADLFTDSIAGLLMKRKYKYIVSRYGHSANIAAWEFFNEADLMAGKAGPMNRWHVAMAKYVKSIDVHRRLVSSSATRRGIEKVVDAFRTPGFDFVMYHDYNMLDVAPHLMNVMEMGEEFYHKPVVIGEFGIEYRGGELTNSFDPEHIGLHNGMWAGFFDETPILPMTWWWDSYIDKYNVWPLFGNLTRFADSLDFGARPLVFKQLEPDFRMQYPKAKSLCIARMLQAGKRYAFWFKSGNYIWSAKTTGIKQVKIDSFIQKVPGVLPGSYSVIWYDPHKGNFADTTVMVAVADDGILTFTVPPFAKDMVCLVVPVN
jgi:hypothetical protein